MIENILAFAEQVCSFWHDFNMNPYIRGSLNKFPDFFHMGTFIDSTHMKMHLLYRSNNFWKAPWKYSCVNVSMTFVAAFFISSIVS